MPTTTRASEYLWVLLAIDPEHGQVWLRQGDPEVLGMSRSDLPMEFDRWNAVLNQLGAKGWEVISTELLQDEAKHEQLWLLRRDVS